MSDSAIDPRERLIANYGLKLADHSDITGEILKMMNERGEDWPWIERWKTEDAPLWTNSPNTMVFEVPPGQLVDRQAVDFTQDVWMSKPSVFEHQTWGGRTFVRMSWARR